MKNSPEPRLGRGGRAILLPKTARPTRSANLAGEHIPLTQKLTEIQLIEMDLYVSAKADRERKRRSLPEDATAWLAAGSFSGDRRLRKHDADNLWREAQRAFAKAAAL